MAEENVPATFTVKVYSKEGLTIVAGVATKGIRDEVIVFIHTNLKGWKPVGDWYLLGDDRDVQDVVAKAKELDDKAEIYNVEVKGPGIDVAGKNAVLFYFSGRPYKVTAIHEEIQKSELEAYIICEVRGRRYEDWYRVYDKADIEKITNFAGGPTVQGETFNMVII